MRPVAYQFRSFSTIRYLLSTCAVGILAIPLLVAQRPEKESYIVLPKVQQNAPGTVSIQQLSHVVPGKALKAFQKAEKARLAGHNSEAAELYQAALVIDPEYVSALNNMAMVRMMEDKLEPALKALTEAIKLDPHNPLLLRNLAMGYELARQFEAAERAARQSIDLDRTDLPARMLLGLALAEQQKFTEEALRCFERAFDRFAFAHLMAGGILLGQGELEKARAEIQTYVASGERDNRDLAMKWLDWIERYDSQVKVASAK